MEQGKECVWIDKKKRATEGAEKKPRVCGKRKAQSVCVKIDKGKRGTGEAGEGGKRARGVRGKGAGEKGGGTRERPRKTPGRRGAAARAARDMALSVCV